MPLTYERRCSSVAFGPLQHQIEPQAVCPCASMNGDVVHRLGAALGDDLFEVVDEPLRVLEDRRWSSSVSSSKTTFTPLWR